MDLVGCGWDDEWFCLGNLGLTVILWLNGYIWSDIVSMGDSGNFLLIMLLSYWLA